MVIFQASSAVSALLRVNDIGIFALVNSPGGAFVKTAAALDAVFGDFVRHEGIP